MTNAVCLLTAGTQANTTDNISLHSGLLIIRAE